MSKLVIIGLLFSGHAIAMTEFEQKMLDIEIKRLEMQRESLESQLLSNKVQRCMAYKTYSIGSMFNAPEDCSIMSKPAPQTEMQQTCKRGASLNGC